MSSPIPVVAPLNINLGAYSPALVVGMLTVPTLPLLTRRLVIHLLTMSPCTPTGDGEIKLSGNGAEVSNLINSLEGAAINAAATGEARAGQPAPVVAAPAVPAPNPVQPAAPAATSGVAAAGAADPALQEQVRRLEPRDHLLP